METDDKTTTATTTSASVEYVPTTTATDALVEVWFRDTFHNRGLDPNEANRLIAAKERLQALLRGIVKE